MIITMIIVIISIFIMIILLTPKGNEDKSSKKNTHEIYVRDEKMILSDPIRYESGSPGENSRVLTKSYYSLFFENKNKSNSAAQKFLKHRNDTYGSITGKYLDNNYLNFITNKHHHSISTLIFFICLHETYTEKHNFYEENFALEVYKVILEEHNKTCIATSKETNEFSIEKYKKIKDTYEFLRSFSEQNKNENKTSLIESVPIINKNEYNLEEKTKFQISTLFYQFCFSDYTAKVFLVNNSMSENISKGLKISRFQLQKINILESIFKINLKKNHGVELGDGSFGFYTLNGFRFFLDTQRISTEDSTSYFEILYNDFEGVTDEDGNEMSIAKEFIVFIKNYEPKAIFVLVFDALLETYALRRVKENGVSFKLTFLNSIEGSESIDFLTNYIIIENL